MALLHHRADRVSISLQQTEPLTDSEIQQQLHFQSMYPSMVTAGGVQTAVVCSGSLNVRSCKVLWKSALFQLVATTIAPSHANTVDADEDADESDGRVDARSKDDESGDKGKRGSLRYSLVFFKRGLLGRPRRKCIDLSDGSARFRWSKDGQLLSTRFEFSLDYFAASSNSDHAVAKTLTCRADNATEYLAWTSALRGATEYAAEQWRLQSLSRLTLGNEQQKLESRASTSPKASVQRRRVSVLSIDDLATAESKPEQQPRTATQPRGAQPERQMHQSQRRSDSKRRATLSTSKRSKKPAVVKQLPPFRERRRGSDAKASSAVPSATGLSASSGAAQRKKPAVVKQLPPFRERSRDSLAKTSSTVSTTVATTSDSIAQSKKAATAPPPMFPTLFDSNSSVTCFLTTANSFADTKNVPMLGSSRSLLSSSFAASTRTRRRLRSRVGFTSLSRRRKSGKRRRRRGSAAKPVSMAKMVRIRAVEPPFGASAPQLSVRRAVRGSQPSTRIKTEVAASDASAALAMFQPYSSVAQPKSLANVMRRRVRADTNALDELLLGSQRSSDSEQDGSSRDEAHAHLAPSAAHVNALRANQRAPAASIHEYLASVQQRKGSSDSSHNDVSALDDSLPVSRTTEYVNYLVMVAEMRAGTSQSQSQSQSQARRTQQLVRSASSNEEQRARSRSSAPAMLTQEDDVLFLTARSALDLNFDSDDSDDESSELDEDSRRQAWRAYLSDFETEL